MLDGDDIAQVDHPEARRQQGVVGAGEGGVAHPGAGEAVHLDLAREATKAVDLEIGGERGEHRQGMPEAVAGHVQGVRGVEGLGGREHLLVEEGVDEQEAHRRLGDLKATVAEPD
jgi:hypothetical protein